MGSEKGSNQQTKAWNFFQGSCHDFRGHESITFDDPDHSADEDRFLTIGKSRTGKVLLVSHTDRGSAIRIISARRATTKENNFYEEEK